MPFLNLFCHYSCLKTAIFLHFKSIAMITAEQHLALIEECKIWHQTLAKTKQMINELKNELYLFAPGKTAHSTLEGIEHFHNQFHIQLINIHDLKHEIKHHVTEAERHPNFGHRIPHHYLKEKLDALLGFIENLKNEFHQFILK